MSVAERVAESENPHTRAVALFIRRELNNETYPHTKTYHFADGSYLVFEVEYRLVASGLK